MNSGDDKRSREPSKGNVVKTGPLGALSDSHFEFLRELAMKETGISLEESKRPMLQARLMRRLTRLNLDSIDEYVSKLDNPNGRELASFINLVTTNLTFFFREPIHYAYLTKTALPDLLARSEATAPIRIWSAGCSTGQEPYSLAISIKSMANPPKVDPKLLCTDINGEVLETGKLGRFKREDLRGLTQAQVKTWFDPIDESCFEVKHELKSMLLFKQLNLFSHWPIRGPIDIVFCRNVMIYFSREQQKELVSRFAEIIAVGGYLFLGHSESLAFETNRFSRVSTTTYQRVK